MSCATLVLLIPLLFCHACAQSSSDGTFDSITVFAAASTGDVIRQTAAMYEAETGVEVRLSIASSSILAQQIRAGARADVFLSANQQWMDALQADGIIKSEQRLILLENSLVLVATKQALTPQQFQILIEGEDPFANVSRFAIADPDHVPAGIYARQVLTNSNLWQSLNERLITTTNVRAALRLIEHNEVDAGIIYATDAKTLDEEQFVVIPIPSTFHDPIRYPLATCTTSPNALAFVEFLHSPASIKLLTDAGFVIPSRVGTEDHNADS